MSITKSPPTSHEGALTEEVSKKATAVANDVEQAGGGSGSSFKLLLLVMLVLQNTSTVLVGRYTRSGVPESKLLQSLNMHVFQHPWDALKIMVPALLYLVQNTLLFVALSNLTAPIFQVTYQAKLVTTAIVSVFMLNRSYSLQQWVCLFVLSLGVAIVVLGEKKGGGGSARRLAEEAPAAQNLILGLTSVGVACFSSALAGVYFEKVLKKPGAETASLWMRNIQLSFFSVVIAALKGLFKKDAHPENAYLHGFTFWAWVLVLSQAGGGLLVAAVIKYADNVLKGLATGVSVVFATTLSMLFLNTKVTGQFTLGATMILSSVYFFSNPLPSKKEKRTDDDLEMSNLLPTKERS